MIHTVGNDSKYAKFKILLNLYLVSVPWSPVGCSALCLTPFGQISGRSSGNLGSMGPIHSGPAPGSHPSAAWPASRSCTPSRWSWHRPNAVRARRWSALGASGGALAEAGPPGLAARRSGRRSWLINDSGCLLTNGITPGKSNPEPDIREYLTKVPKPLSYARASGLS